MTHLRNGRRFIPDGLLKRISPLSGNVWAPDVRWEVFSSTAALLSGIDMTSARNFLREDGAAAMFYEALLAHMVPTGALETEAQPVPVLRALHTQVRQDIRHG